VAHLVAPHVIEIPVVVVSVIELLTAANHDSAILDINVHDNSCVPRPAPCVRALPIDFLGRYNRPRKYVGVFRTSLVLTSALEVIVELWRLVALPGALDVARSSMCHLGFDALLAVQFPTELIACHLTILVEIPAGQHEAWVGTAFGPSIFWTKQAVRPICRSSFEDRFASLLPIFSCNLRVGC
jgi:hypothetical protein